VPTDRKLRSAVIRWRQRTEAGNDDPRNAWSTSVELLVLLVLLLEEVSPALAQGREDERSSAAIAICPKHANTTVS
jgi:hypothetical protein